MDGPHRLSVAGSAEGVSQVAECLHAVAELGAAAGLGACAGVAGTGAMIRKLTRSIRPTCASTPAPADLRWLRHAGGRPLSRWVDQQGASADRRSGLQLASTSSFTRTPTTRLQAQSGGRRPDDSQLGRNLGCAIPREQNRGEPLARAGSHRYAYIARALLPGAAKYRRRMTILLV